jgi:hypothetical protein
MSEGPSDEPQLDVVQPDAAGAGWDFISPKPKILSSEITFMVPILPVQPKTSRRLCARERSKNEAS